MENCGTTIEQRKKRWRDFYDPDRPARHMLLVRHQHAADDRPQPHPENKGLRIEWAWRKYQRQMDRLEWLDDDAIPHLDVYTGTEIFANAFGCGVHRPADNMPFALPAVEDAAGARSIKSPSLDSPSLALCFEIADELRRRAGPEAVLRLVDIQSPMDIAALIWNKNTFYIGLLETPEAVLELAAKVSSLLTAFLDEWFSRYGRSFVAHYPDYFMPAGITLSEDEVGAVNAEMFEELFLPELTALSDRYGGMGMHCCANARHQWEGFKKIPNLRLLNLVQPVPELKKAYAYFARHVPQMHSWCGDGDPATWPDQYPPGSRVVLQADAKTKEDAIRISRQLRQKLG